MKKMTIRSFLLVCILCALCLCGCRKHGTPTITSNFVSIGYSIDDKSYNSKVWDGILGFYGDIRGEEEHFGTLYDVTSCWNAEKIEPALLQISEAAQTDLIICSGVSMERYVLNAANRFPEQKYLCIDGSFAAGIPQNIMNFVFSAEEGSYLVGAAAAMQALVDSAPPQFGFIGGEETPGIKEFELGFMQGVLSVIPEAELYSAYVGDWTSPDKASAIAKRWYDNDVYAIFSAAGASGNGTIAQAVAHRKVGKNVWAIGVDRDQFEEGTYGIGKSAVLTSMVKNIDRAVSFGLSLVQKNEFRGGTITLGLKEDGVGYTRTNKELNETVVKILLSITDDIINERIRICTFAQNQEEAEHLLRNVRH